MNKVEIWKIFMIIMDNFTILPKTGFPLLQGIAPDFIRYPPNSKPSFGVNQTQKIKEQFSNQGASMLPKLQDFNQMFRQQANSLIKMNSNVLPPGHPLFSRENSLFTLKEENEKLMKENLELKKKLTSKTNKR